MMYLKQLPTKAGLLLSAALFITGCEGGLDFGRVGDIVGANGSGNKGAESLPRPDPDPRGVITYSSYQVLVAREGDSISTMATRVGLTPDELANHNGLPTTYTPRAGEVMALPRNVGGSPADNVWSPDIAISAIETATLTAPGTPTPPPPRVQNGRNPFSNGQTGSVVDPIRHRVRAGETVFSIARLYGISVTALASWNGLNSEMTLRNDQELLIPVANRVVTPEAEVVEVANDPGTPSELPLPPSSVQPLPVNEDIDKVVVPASPNLVEERTPPGASRALLLPVAGGTVIRPYNTSGPRKNEGIDYGAAAGSEVRAAEAGEVALISNSLGGLGTIILIRHPDDLMTVYGRVSGVNLKKGDRVNRGQRIGVVADGDTPNLHFEIRRGTESVDPAPYL